MQLLFVAVVSIWVQAPLGQIFADQTENRLEAIREAFEQSLEEFDLPAAEAALAKLPQTSERMILHLTIARHYELLGMVQESFEHRLQSFHDARAVANDFSPDSRSRPYAALPTLAVAAVRAGRQEAMSQLIQQMEMAAAREDAQVRDVVEKQGYLVYSRIDLLTGVGREREALALLNNRLNGLRQQFAQQQDVDAAERLVEALQRAATALPLQADAFQAEAKRVVLAVLERFPESNRAVGMYVAILYSEALALGAWEVDQAQQEFREIRKAFDKVYRTSELRMRKLAFRDQDFKQIEASLKAKAMAPTLVGDKAPPWDIAFWANGQPLDRSALQGRVILLYFWGVWSDPCRQAYPELRRWQEAFGRQGLQIVGVTRKQNYFWSDPLDRPMRRVRGTNTDQEEAAVLTRFMRQHGLQHATFVTPEGSAMQAAHFVDTLPHFLLIDREGIVRMVQVGASKAHFAAIHEKLGELLAQ